MKRRMAVILMAVLLLTGCAPLLDREYRVQELHSNKYLEGDNIEILRAESYQDMVNDLLLLVGERKEQAIVRLYADGQKVKIADLLEQAAQHDGQSKAQYGPPLSALSQIVSRH